MVVDESAFCRSVDGSPSLAVYSYEEETLEYVESDKDTDGDGENESIEIDEKRNRLIGVRVVLVQVLVPKPVRDRRQGVHGI